MHYCEKRMDGKKQNEIKQWGREIKSTHTDWFISLIRWIKKKFFFLHATKRRKVCKTPTIVGLIHLVLLFHEVWMQANHFLIIFAGGVSNLLRKKNSDFNVKQPGICQIKYCKCSIFACLPCQVKASIIQSFQCLPCQVKAIIIPSFHSFSWWKK